AHEINNPLGGILAVSSLDLEDCSEDHPLRKDLELIVKQTLRCREIVKGLLDFSRQSDARTVRVEFNQIVESSLGLVKRQALFQDVRIALDLQPNLPFVLFDPGQLQQVVINIVLNAVDAMEGHGTLNISTAMDQATGDVRLSISDTGKGVPAEIMPMIFEPFFTTKKVGEGTGLGLAIVHGIVTRAGGHIEVASVPGRTTFTVRLPAAPDDDLAVAPTAAR
ncbi:MAG: two-component sensor histidine kinase, partial [Deltaproteobacteria bacterium]|nr:two-component sensor histidine kinase [Deltaproteobacteria bacterium]